MPTPKFPVSILQNSVKMTMEPPVSLKQNMTQLFDNVEDREFTENKQPKNCKRLYYALAFFHSICIERKKFGAIGWNIRYSFTLEDFGVSVRQMKDFLNDFEVIPYQVIQFITAEINYGGRITDYIDGILANCIIKKYVNPDAIKDDFYYSEAKTYGAPPDGTKDDILRFIKDLPMHSNPEAFGLHENAEITTNQGLTRTMLETVIMMQPRTSGGGGMSREEIIDSVTKSTEEQTPKPFDLLSAGKKYATDYNACLNTVLT